MAEKVWILLYLGSLAFLEFGMPYVVKTVSMEEEPNFDLTRMVLTSDIVSVWAETNKVLAIRCPRVRDQPRRQKVDKERMPS